MNFHQLPTLRWGRGDLKLKLPPKAKCLKILSKIVDGSINSRSEGHCPLDIMTIIRENVLLNDKHVHIHFKIYLIETGLSVPTL